MKRQKVCKYSECGAKFTPSRWGQQTCGLDCAIKLTREKKKAKHAKLVVTVEPEKIRRHNDKLYQLAGRKLYPKSIISGEDTEVIHHWIYKSQSNNTRYDLEDNAIPLTIKEHDQIHNRKSGSDLLLQITIKKGQEWQERLLQKSRILYKLNISNLTTINNKLKEILDS